MQVTSRRVACRGDSTSPLQGSPNRSRLGRPRSCCFCLHARSRAGRRHVGPVARRPPPPARSPSRCSRSRSTASTPTLVNKLGRRGAPNLTRLLPQRRQHEERARPGRADGDAAQPHQPDHRPPDRRGRRRSRRHVERRHPSRPDAIQEAAGETSRRSSPRRTTPAAARRCSRPRRSSPSSSASWPDAHRPVDDRAGQQDLAVTVAIRRDLVATRPGRSPSSTSAAGRRRPRARLVQPPAYLRPPGGRRPTGSCSGDPEHERSTRDIVQTADHRLVHRRSPTPRRLEPGAPTGSRRRRRRPHG